MREIEERVDRREKIEQCKDRRVVKKEERVDRREKR
jgi:hypothetical protein